MLNYIKIRYLRVKKNQTQKCISFPVPCGKGLVYREESGQCEKCPMGTYKGGNDIECKPCGNGMTTVNEGETSMTKCVGEYQYKSEKSAHCYVNFSCTCSKIWTDWLIYLSIYMGLCSSTYGRNSICF